MIRKLKIYTPLALTIICVVVAARTENILATKIPFLVVALGPAGFLSLKNGSIYTFFAFWGVCTFFWVIGIYADSKKIKQPFYALGYLTWAFIGICVAGIGV